MYRELRRRIRELTLAPGALLRKEEIALEEDQLADLAGEGRVSEVD